MITFLTFLTIQAVNLSLLIAQATSATPTDVGGWLTMVNVGLAGVGLLAFVRGWIVPGVIHTQSLKREEANLIEIQALRKIIDDKVIPELVKGRTDGEKMIALTEDFLELVKTRQILADRHQASQRREDYKAGYDSNENQ